MSTLSLMPDSRCSPVLISPCAFPPSCAAYATKKAELLAERERREAEKRALKDAERKRVADAVEANYTAWMAREKARLDKDISQVMSDPVFRSGDIDRSGSECRSR